MIGEVVPAFLLTFTLTLAAISLESKFEDTVICQDWTNVITQILVNGQTPTGGPKIPIMHILFNRETRVPITSTVVFDDWSRINNAPNGFRFRKVLDSVLCHDIQRFQQNCHDDVSFSFTHNQWITHGNCYTWHKGHLTPLSPMRFSEEAANLTYRCINAAPQDPFTNQGSWRVVERTVKNFGAENPGYVITGTCPNPNEQDGIFTAGGEWIPDCWWKLFCYKDINRRQTVVVGYYAPNHLIPHRNETLKDERRNITKQVRSQAEIFHLTGIDQEIVNHTWAAAGYLVSGRPGFNYPIPMDCFATLELQDDIRQEWEGRMRAQENIMSCDEDQCEECEDEF